MITSNCINPENKMNNYSEEITAFVNSLPKGNVSWKNLNPTAVVKEVNRRNCVSFS